MSDADAGLDAAEVAKFEAMAAEWWDPNGKFRPLHALNPARLDYIAEQVAAEFGRDRAEERPFAGLTVVDVGCGGGLACEPMARLGAEVVGLDPAEANLGVARLHAARTGLEIDYRRTTAESLAAEGARFDVVLCLEVVEHVPDPAAFLAACGALVRPGGLMACSTINRTARSFALAVVGAERVLRWLPPGTHDWNRFVTPDELAAMLGEAGLEVVDRTGFVFDPLRRDWRRSRRDLAVNYAATAVRPG